MLTSIFSSFDPSLTPSESSFIMLIIAATLILLMQPFWMIPTSTSRVQTAMMCLSKTLMAPTSGAKMKGTHMMITSMFYSITLMNLMGMVPYVFSMTAHLMITLSLALPLWMAMVLTSLSTLPKKTLAKLLPEGAPSPLSPFLTTVELISSCIRPLTLAFRLTANITAGHVILSMMHSFQVYQSMWQMSSGIMEMIVMNYAMFEFIVCVIQAFVFVLLMSMYTNDYM